MNHSTFINVAALADVPEGRALEVDVHGQPILLTQCEGHVFALSAICSHAQESLACGRVRNGWIACPVHGARFDLETGEALSLPATEPITTYTVRIKDDSVEVAV